MSNLEGLFSRYYTKALAGRDDLTVYDLFEWSKRDVLLQDYKSGKVLTDMKGLDFPTHYSQNAVDIIASKYKKFVFCRSAVNCSRRSSCRSRNGEKGCAVFVQGYRHVVSMT